MAASVHAVDGSSDKAGTNPVNFTQDVRLYNEFLWLNTKGDGEQNITTSIRIRDQLLRVPYPHG